MTGGHGADALLLRRRGPLHAQPAHAKLLALVTFIVIVVATPGLPPEAFLGGADKAAAWAAGRPYAAYALLLGAVTAFARVPTRVVLRRAVVEAPFVVFALLMPFVAAGERVAVGPLSLSAPGLAGGLTLIVKATIGVVGAVLLAATTSSRELLVGLERLRLPASLIAILSFMVRYIAVVADDGHRMRIARESRGAPRGQTRALVAMAAGAGSLFVRSFERGERVHRAMLSRGYSGRIPPLRDDATGSGGRCALLPGAALLVLVASRMIAQ